MYIYRVIQSDWKRILYYNMLCEWIVRAKNKIAAFFCFVFVLKVHTHRLLIKIKRLKRNKAKEKAYQM